MLPVGIDSVNYDYFTDKHLKAKCSHNSSDAETTEQKESVDWDKSPHVPIKDWGKTQLIKTPIMDFI